MTSGRLTPAGSREAVTRDALRAVPYLAGRQAAAQLVNILGGLAVARWLTPGEFGVFAIVVFTHGVMNASAGPGLATGLVRAPANPDDNAIRSAFTVVQVASVAVASMAWMIAPPVARWYGAPDAAATALRLAAIALVVGSWQAVPSALLERRLDFKGIAVVELSQALAFHVTNLALVFTGHGVVSVGMALVARALAGAVLASARCPWRPRYLWAIAPAQQVLAFGAPFQGATVVAMLKDSLTPVLVGLAAGATAVGHVTWAQAVAGFPSMAASVFQRLFLPAFARLQHDRAALGRVVDDALRAMHLVVAPVAVLLLVLIDPIVSLVFGEPWRAAIPVFALLWVANVFAPTVTPALAVLHAVGRARAVLGVSAAWAVATWVLGGPLVWWYGAVGYGLANVGVQAVNAWLFRMVRHEVRFAWARAMLPGWSVAALVGVGLVAAQAWWPAANAWNLVALAAAGLASHAGLAWAIAAAGARRGRGGSRMAS